MARDSAPTQNAPLESASQRSPSAPGKVATTDQGTPASAYGLLGDNAGFVARLGPSGWRLGAEFVSGEQVSLEGLSQPIPGVHFDTAQWRSSKLKLCGHLSIPFLDTAEFEASVDHQGSAKITGKASKQLALPALGNPQIHLSMAETGALSGEINAEGLALLPKSLRGKATVIAAGTIRLADGRLSGGGTAQISYSDFGNGDIKFNFNDTGAFSASGTLKITPPFVEEVTGTIALDEAGNLSASAKLMVGDMQSRLPGLSLTGGQLNVDYMNGMPTGSLEGFSAAYPGLGSVSIERAAINAQGFEGSGVLNLAIPGLNEASGQVAISNGRVSGSVRLGADAFPEGLPVQQPTITATLSEGGRVGVAGSAKVQLGPAGTGNLTAGYSEAGAFSLGGDVQLTIPGLDTVTAHIGYAEGQISGEVQVPVNTALLPGLDGTVTVRYAQDRWSGETTLDFSADNGKLSGTVTVTVAQTDDGALELGGEGSVTAQLMPRLQGTLTASILPEGGVDVSGVIEVTEPLELFPEQRMDRELFRYSQNIPLWAILVAVIRVRAGVRAGVGPGVFRNIRVEGSYTLGAEESDPSFNVSGELYIPAFVEGYVAVGAGLGLDVVLGSLTGGIEAVGTAGLYGAISAVPELTYADGDWGIEGTATLAAGARLKLGLNAWAEIEALWVTVWDKEWNLAEVVMPVGPDLGLQAHMAYKFGQPEPPSIEMSSSEIDTERLIQGAMPKDGPAPSGAREALKNKAEWKGKLREQRQAAIPAEQVAQQSQTETPPPAPPRPQKTTGAPPSEKNDVTDEAAIAEASVPDSSMTATVPEGSLPDSDQPRHSAAITLAMLDEPPVPMPRTPSQKKQDLEAAKRATELASDQASDTEALSNYFPSIKRRFGLVSLGYEGDFEKGFNVVGKINDFKVPLEKLLLQGDGAMGGRKTEITFSPSTALGGSEVGVKMTAEPLGPEHPKGTETGNQQPELMDQLPTSSTDHPDAASYYVRGHLLHFNLGGLADDRNLFPITKSANALHNTRIENFVDNWVNVRKMWIEYVVEVKGAPQLDTAGDNKEITIVKDATFDATAKVLGADGKPIGKYTKHIEIKSTYGAPAKVSTGENDTIGDDKKAIEKDLEDEAQSQQRERPEDQNITPKLLPGKKPIELTREILADLKKEVEPKEKELKELRGRFVESDIKLLDDAIKNGVPPSEDQKDILRGAIRRLRNKLKKLKSPPSGGFG